jgi:hypothetical protein
VTVPRRELEHVYRDWKGAQGRCHVRIYHATEASGHLPVVIVTDPNDNDGPSVTNTIEQLGAEILSRYLPDQDGLDPPFVLVEHYPDRQPRGVEARWHDPFFGETFDVVTFKTCSPRPRWTGPRRGMLQSFGTPDWRHLSRQEVETLIGEALGWPACTCRDRSGAPVSTHLS